MIATSHKSLCAKRNRRVCVGLLGSVSVFRPYCLVTACVRAKSLQLCLTLCDPIDCSPPGSSVHGILQARSCCSVTQSCLTLCSPMDCTRQASLTLTISWGFPKFMSIVISDAIPIASSDTFFSFCPQSFLASVSFPMSQFFVSGDQNTGVSASASGLPMIIQG